MVESKKQKNGRKGKSILLADPNTIIHASKPLAEFVEWQNSLLAVPGSLLYRVRKWGDPLMVARGWDFPGKKRPKVFYIPFEWLEPKAA